MSTPQGRLAIGSLNRRQCRSPSSSQPTSQPANLATITPSDPSITHEACTAKPDGASRGFSLTVSNPVAAPLCGLSTSTKDYSDSHRAADAFRSPKGSNAARRNTASSPSLQNGITTSVHQTEERRHHSTGENESRIERSGRMQCCSQQEDCRPTNPDGIKLTGANHHNTTTRRHSNTRSMEAHALGSKASSLQHSTAGSNTQPPITIATPQLPSNPADSTRLDTKSHSDRFSTAFSSPDNLVVNVTNPCECGTPARRDSTGSPSLQDGKMRPALQEEELWQHSMAENELRRRSQPSFDVMDTRQTKHWIRLCGTIYASPGNVALRLRHDVIDYLKVSSARSNARHSVQDSKSYSLKLSVNLTDPRHLANTSDSPNSGNPAHQNITHSRGRQDDASVSAPQEEESQKCPLPTTMQASSLVVYLSDNWHPTAVERFSSKQLPNPATPQTAKFQNRGLWKPKDKAQDCRSSTLEEYSATPDGTSDRSSPLGLRTSKPQSIRDDHKQANQVGVPLSRPDYTTKQPVRRVFDSTESFKLMDTRTTQPSQTCDMTALSYPSPSQSADLAKILPSDPLRTRSALSDFAGNKFSPTGQHIPEFQSLLDNHQRAYIRLPETISRVLTRLHDANVITHATASELSTKVHYSEQAPQARQAAGCTKNNTDDIPFMTAKGQHPSPEALQATKPCHPYKCGDSELQNIADLPSPQHGMTTLTTSKISLTSKATSPRSSMDPALFLLVLSAKLATDVQLQGAKAASWQHSKAGNDIQSSIAFMDSRNLANLVAVPRSSPGASDKDWLATPVSTKSHRTRPGTTPASCDNAIKQLLWFSADPTDHLRTINASVPPNGTPQEGELRQYLTAENELKLERSGDLQGNIKQEDNLPTDLYTTQLTGASCHDVTIRVPPGKMDSQGVADTHSLIPNSTLALPLSSKSRTDPITYITSQPTRNQASLSAFPKSGSNASNEDYPATSSSSQSLRNNSSVTPLSLDNMIRSFYQLSAGSMDHIQADNAFANSSKYRDTVYLHAVSRSTPLEGQNMPLVGNAILNRCVMPSMSAAGTALQKTEYANGHVVRSTVRAGMDDDDWDINDYLDDSASHQASRMSGTSTTPSEYVKKDDAMQLLFCEHRRITSKDAMLDWGLPFKIAMNKCSLEGVVLPVELPVDSHNAEPLFTHLKPCISTSWLTAIHLRLCFFLEETRFFIAKQHCNIAPY